MILKTGKIEKYQWRKKQNNQDSLKENQQNW